jgi:hypothetical protein
MGRAISEVWAKRDEMEEFGEATPMLCGMGLYWELTVEVQSLTRRGGIRITRLR